MKYLISKSISNQILSKIDRPLVKHKLFQSMLSEQEEFDSENKNKPSDRMKSFLRNLDYETGVKYAGGTEEYLNLAFDGDLEEFSKSKLPLVVFDPKEVTLKIHKLLIDRMNLPSDSLGKFLGKFSTKKNYLFTLRIRHHVSSKGYSHLSGQSGDYGFGLSLFSKKNTAGKREKLELYKKVIDKYNLERFM